MRPTHMLRYVLFACTLAAPALFSTPAQAQTQKAPVVAHIPFDFKAGASQLRAGTYTLRQPTDLMLMLRTASEAAALFTIPSQDRNPASSSRLVFHRYGDRYFLREIWLESRSEHLTVRESKDEKKLRNELLHASNPAPSTDVELALLDEPR